MSKLRIEFQKTESEALLRKYLQSWYSNDSKGLQFGVGMAIVKSQNLTNYDERIG